MKAEETKHSLKKWFIPVVMIIGISLTYNDITSTITAKINLPLIKEQSPVKNYHFNEEIQNPIERSKDLKTIKEVCSASITKTLNDAKNLTAMLQKENKEHDAKWRIATESRWRREMLEYLEDAAINSIEVAWKINELCQIEEYLNHKTEEVGTAYFHKILQEKKLESTHLQRFKSHLSAELEAAVANFNEANDKRLIHLARYPYDVTYKRSPFAWLRNGPVGQTIKSFLRKEFNFTTSILQMIKPFQEKFPSLHGMFDKITIADFIQKAKSFMKKKEETGAKKTEGLSPPSETPANPKLPNPSGKEKDLGFSPAHSLPQPETQATSKFFPGEKN